jgi:amino acid adenylation domain-containing protein/thioester reductase-like protein
MNSDFTNMLLFDPELKAEKDYWIERLSADLTYAALRPDHEGADDGTTAQIDFRAGAGLYAELQRVTSSSPLLIYAALVGAVKVCLYRHTGVRRVTVGSPAFCGDEGSAVPNALVVVDELDARMPFRSLLLDVRQTLLDAYARQRYPFERLVRNLRVASSNGRPSLFNVSVALEEIHGPLSAPVPDLAFVFSRGANGLAGRLTYRSGRFEEATASRFLGHVLEVLADGLAHPEQAIGRLSMLNAAEVEAITETNRTAAARPSDICLHELIEAEARRRPEAIAVRFPSEASQFSDGPELTYEELDRRGDELAAHLRARGVGREVCVAVYAQPSLDTIVALLAILKAGGAYVPVDPNYPSDRIAYMLHDCGATVVLTDAALAPSLPLTGAHVIRIDIPLDGVPPAPKSVPATADNIAYVIYTSGTTGRPKGVLVPHRGVVNLVREAARLFGVSEESRVLQQASLSFDASVLEIFMALCSGATLILVERRVLLSPPVLACLLREQRVAALAATPSLLGLLPREPFPDLAVVSTGGEPCPAPLVNFWSQGRRLLNVYAPTEATVFSTSHLCAGPYDSTPPMGHPIANAEIHVLDEMLELVPVGVVGEVYVGGAGVTRGYLGLPGLTAERFVPDPFSGRPGARLYRSGDLVRRTPSGEIEFVGRADDQVKLRGFRIELAEVEAVLAQHPLVRESVVAMREDGGEKCLVGYVVPGGGADDSAEDGATMEAAHLAHWQVLYDEMYVSTQPSDHRFDINGWNSSYTGQMIAEQEMREWLDSTVALLTSFRPKKVLEIGCGSGLVLYRVAPQCDEYFATDFSAVVLERVERELRRPGRELSNVILSHRTAADFDGITARSFDLVVLNSVVQYFPSVEYFLSVVKGAVERTRPGGVVFLGDVRSLALQETLHLSLEFHRAPHALRLDEFNDRVAAAMRREEELLLHPAIFSALRATLPRISHVEILPERGQHHNELNRFRYQVLLHVEAERAVIDDLSWRDWRESSFGLERLEEMLRESRPCSLAFSDIPNARLAQERAVRSLLRAEDRPKTLGDLRLRVTTAIPDGVDPEELVALGARAGYDVQLRWDAHDADGAFDAVFLRLEPGSPPRIVPQHARAGELTRPDERPLAEFANSPARAQASYSLSARLKNFLQEKLPDVMVPSLFVELPELPRRPNGKIDKTALPFPGKDRSAVATEYVAPVGETERAITAIWQGTLGIERIGIRDNFFDLGGHSLLMVRVHSLLRERFGDELSLVDLFTYPTVESLAKHILGGRAEAEHAARPEPRSAPTPEPQAEAVRETEIASTDIAVIAMAGRFPGARNLEELWELLREGREVIKRFSSEELIAAGAEPEVIADSRYVPAAGVLDDIELFDAGFFGYNAREAQMMDPQQRIFLEAAWEVLERAGYDSDSYRGKIGVVAGLGMNTYFVHNLLANRALLEQMGAFQTMLGNSNDLLTTRVSYQLNLTGPSVNVQTGCSTSLVAVHLACQSLLNRECHMALAGGVAILIPQEQGYLYAEGGVCSIDGHCRAFDASATGAIPGRGMGIVVLKRLEEARADGDTILAVIKGSAINNDGASKVGYTAPGLVGQRQAISDALAVAGINPETVSYVEAHGTATVVGDPIELRALIEAYRAHTSAERFCALGSIKTNMGHPDIAAGIAGLIKTVMALSHGEIPPSLHFKQPNPNVDIEHSPFYINTALTPWTNSPRRAAVNSLGIGGTNCHVILEEAPPREPSEPPRPWQLIVLSAKTPTALSAASRNLAQFLRANPETNLADVAHTLRVGRRAFKHRRMLVCRDLDDAVSQLERDTKATVQESREREVVFLFPGQGAQHTGMAAEIYESEPVFREAFDRCAELALPLLSEDLRVVVYPAPEDREAAEERLRQTAVAQPALFAVEYALARLWMSWGIYPARMLGHSLGEFTAACLADVFTLPEAISLVVERGRVMQSLPPGGMLAVPLGEREARALVGDRLSIASVNGEEQCVVAGEFEALHAFEQELRARGIEGRRLATSHAFHSHMVDAALPAFREAVAATERHAPSRPFISCTTGRAISETEAPDPEYWVRHLRQTVRFGAALRTVLADSEAVVLEVGPGQVLTDLAKRHPGLAPSHLVVPSLPRPVGDGGDRRELTLALGRLWLGGLRPDFEAFVVGERRARIPLPTYPFERKRYWIDGVPARPTASAPRRKAGPQVSRQVWQQSSPAPPPRFVPKRWLVVGAKSSLGAALAARLTEAGCAVTEVEAGTALHKNAPGRFALLPEEAAAWRCLWEALAGEFPDRIVCFTQDAATSFQSLLALGEALGSEGLGDARVALVGSGIEAVSGEEIVHPPDAALAGAAGALPRSIVIDVGRHGVANRRWLSEQLLADIAAGEAGRIAYRGKQRWLLEQSEAPGVYDENEFSAGGAVIIAGDLVGPAWWFSRAWSASAARRSIILLQDSTSESTPRIRALESAGCEVTVLGGRENITGALTRAFAKGDPVAGIVMNFSPDTLLGEAADYPARIDAALAAVAEVGEYVIDHPVGFCLIQTTAGGRDAALEEALASALDCAATEQTQQGETAWGVVTFAGWRCAGGAGLPTVAGDDGSLLTAAEMRDLYGRILALKGTGPVRVSAPVAPESACEFPADEEETTGAETFERPEGLGDYVAPRTPLEERIASVWSQYLGFERVGVEDNFFELGGHSLLASQVTVRIREELGIDVPLRTFFESGTIANLAQALAQAAPAAEAAPASIPHVPRDAPLPLSFAQERMWFFDQLEPGSAAYTVPGCIRLGIALDVRALEASLNEIVRRHEPLRTTFQVVDGQPVQVIAPSLELPLPLIDLTDLPLPEQETRMLGIALTETRRPFDLAAGPLIRATIIKCADEDWVLQVAMHHIIADGWSLGVFIRELGLLYEAFSEGCASPLEPLPVQYADFACWQRASLAGEELERQLAYWKREFVDLPPPLDLPIARPRPAAQTYNGATVSFLIGKQESGGLQEMLALARAEGATLYMVLLGVYAALLGRYTRREDIVIGSPIANRGRSELAGLIGYFANTLALRVDLSGDPSFRELLGRVRELTFGAHAHQDLPFEKLVEELGVERDLRRSPLFDTMLILQNAPMSAADFEKLNISSVPLDKGSAQFDLSWYFTESDASLACTLEYNVDLFPASAVERLVAHFRRLLAGAAAAPDLPLSRHQLVTEEEERMLAAWNPVPLHAPDSESAIHCLVEAQFERTPHAVAVEWGKTAWTYGELEGRANRWARLLCARGVGPETRVALCLRRSPELIAALLGILKAGGAFIPLDPAYPAAWLSYILEESRPRVVLVDAEIASSLQTDSFVIKVDNHPDALLPDECGPLALPAEPRQLAYVLYTSGSTGRPKGVAVEHRSVVALLAWAREVYGAGALSAVLASTSVCFDISVYELFAPLCTGGKVVMVENLLALSDARAGGGVTTINSVPSAVAEILRAGALPPSVRVVNVAGEPVPLTLVEGLLKLPHVNAVYNLYGPTEATVYSTCARLESGENHIGRPVTGTRAYVLDAHMEQVPIGVPGELYLGGFGLARGYLDQPRLTAERFVPDLFGPPGGRLYRTGDLTRFRDDGVLEFLGRIDRQVKLRGFRIELGEVEAALNREPEVREAAVVARTRSDGERELTAFVVPSAVAESPDDEAEYKERWRTVWDDTFARTESEIPTAGWNSSYTGLPFDSVEMREFFDEAGQRLRALPHDAVLEIGCGNGLIFEQLAPTCSRYLGTDVSEAALARFRQLHTRDVRPAVELLHRPADVFDGIPPALFDLVVLHSVAQYWPSVGYLLRVLADGLGALRPGGHLVVADVRSLPLLRAFHASVVLAQAPPGLARAEVNRLSDERAGDEEELVIDPRLFAALEGRFPGVAAVEIQLKGGVARNELTKFRYDVVIRKGGAVPRRGEIGWVDAREGRLDLGAIEQLIAGRDGALGFRGVADARLVPERRLMEALQDETLSSAEDIRAAIIGEDPAALEPASVWEIGRRLGRRVEVRPGPEMGTYDIAFAAAGRATTEIVFPDVPAPGVPLERFSNHPARVAAMRRLRRELGPRLRRSLAASVPGHLVPGTITVVDALPRAPNGKLDLAALERREVERRESPVTFVAPQTETEIALAALWAEVLGVERVGANDNFFDLGGHSLLIARLLHRVQQRLGALIPLRRFFEAPTLRGFAALVDGVLREGETDAAEPPDFTADSSLDPAIQPANDLAPARQVVADLFLTGATGFVGCFLVDELLRRTNATLHCLIRGNGGGEGLNRLRARLRSFGLVDAAESSRLRSITGDLARPRFGLTEEAFDNLAERVDAIMHAGAHVNFIYPYEALRPTNVDGTREVLRLAQRARLKPVHYISTIGVFGGRGAGLYFEDDPFSEGVRARGAYSQSKWVAERLVLQARERGIPASIYRLGTVTGHSTLGTSNAGDFLSRLIRGCISLGLAPDVSFSEDMTPVDYVAAAMVRLALRGDAAPQNYHLVGGDRFRWSEMVGWIAEFGYPLRSVSPPKWLEAVRADADRETANALEPLLPLLAAFAEEAETGRAVDNPTGQMHFDCRNVAAVLDGTSLSCPRLDADLVHTYLDYFVKHDLIPPPRVGRPSAG